MATLFVGIGGLLGVLSRYGISRATLHHEGLLWSTVAINVVGSFLLGLVVAAGWFSRDVREGIGIGFLVASVVGGIAAATAGYVLGRRLATYS
jgi:CrcB protein